MMSETTTTTKTIKEVVVNRVLDAPPSAVWRAWLDPEQLPEWWGSAGVTVRPGSVEVDARAGGAFRLTMLAGEVEVPMNGRFLQVVPLDRLVFDEPEPCMPEMDEVFTVVTFAEGSGGRTRLGFHMTMTTTEQIRVLSQDGWGETFDRLAAHLASVRSGR